MHSKINSCFEMAMTAGREYDLMVRLRPDKPIRHLCFSWRELLDVCRSKPVLFADRAFGAHYAGPMIGDQFAIGTPAVMEVYSRTWTTHPQIASCGLLKFPKAFDGHVSLAQVCWLHGVDVRRAPILFGPLQDAEHLDSSAILQCLSADAAGRMDRLDVEMIEATTEDIKRIGSGHRRRAGHALGRLLVVRGGDANSNCDGLSQQFGVLLLWGEGKTEVLRVVAATLCVVGLSACTAVTG
ncbi:hypothetical protein KXV85_000457, partial [Aspergillus fumigatus]